MAKACSLTCRPSTLVPESELSHRLEGHHGLVPKLSHHSGKTMKTEERNNRVATLKIIKKLISKIIKMFFSGVKRNGVLPLMMSVVAKQRGMMAEAVPEACLQAQAMPTSRRLEELRHQQRGF